MVPAAEPLEHFLPGGLAVPRQRLGELRPHLDLAGDRRELLVASIFEDSPSRGLGEQVAEYASRARKRFLARVAMTGSVDTSR